MTNDDPVAGAPAPYVPTVSSVGTASTGQLGKIRRPWAVIGLSIITLWIYALYWQYATFKELKGYSGEGIGGGIGLLFAILIGIVNVFMMPSETGNLYAAEGHVKPVQGPTGFWVLIPFVGGIIWVIKTQGALNQFWASHGAVPGTP
jgi:hypothetical protein